MHRRFRVGYLLPPIILLLLALLYPSLHRGYEALLLLADVGAVAALPSSYLSQPLRRNTINFSGNGEHYVADLYLAQRGQPRAAIVLQHGAAKGGKDDERLVRLAQQLARARFLVMVPEMPRSKRLQVSSEDIPVLRYAVDYLQQRHLIEAHAPIGIGGISVAAGLAIQAAMRPELRERVDFILSVGGYYDLPQTLDYMTTGYFYLDGVEHRLQPNSYGKWVFVLSNLQRIEDERQRERLGRIAEEKMASPRAVSAALLSQLSGEALHIYNYIENREPGRAPQLRQRLPAAIRGEIRALDLADKELTQLKAQLLLVHGIDDNIIPYSQSIALKRALPQGQARLYLLENWNHVNAQGKGLDGWQMYRVLYRLLEMRDSPSS
jgi:pimeloyl-ACP methyl ester carboxylesterase